MPTVLWQPSEQYRQQSNLWRFIQYVNADLHAAFSDYETVYQWSIDHKAEFWQYVWRFCAIVSSQSWSQVLSESESFPGYEWFRGARLNFAQNLLRHRWLDPDKTALIFRGENDTRRQFSYAQLYTQVARLSHAMRDLGVGCGDRVAAYLPNTPQTVIAMLAATSIGAVWSSCSPDFGVNAVVDRFGQIEPKLLFVSDGYFYKGKAIETLAKAKQIQDNIGSITHTVVLPFISDRPDLSRLSKALLFDELVASQTDAHCHFEQLPFHHPLYILYSSGTTGAPKCIVHGAGGTLIQHLKELQLHTDIKPDDTVFYYTTCGWMMWNWLVSTLATGATVVLYDGAPFYPEPERLIDIAHQENISVFGTSAKYLSALHKSGAKPARRLELPALRTVLSTGSPLSAELYEYVYHDLSVRVQLSSISGGTDIISCFALGNPLLPVHSGELQCRGLGMDVAVYNEAGVAVVGQTGELVCKPPFPSMPTRFWNDPGAQKYRHAYFEKYPGVWSHGDFALLTERGSLIIQGRCDAVLNPGGVRIGTAEIYRPVEQLPQVQEAIAVAQSWRDDTRIVLFVKLTPGITLDEELKAKLREVIRLHASPRHVPAKILQVDDIPRTVSGKIVELAVTHVIHQRPVDNIDALANPEALAQFSNRPELQED
jgi:acetoacetyl-CoA synthetase